MYIYICIYMLIQSYSCIHALHFHHCSAVRAVRWQRQITAAAVCWANMHVESSCLSERYNMHPMNAGSKFADRQTVKLHRQQARKAASRIQKVCERCVYCTRYLCRFSSTCREQGMHTLLWCTTIACKNCPASGLDCFRRLQVYYIELLRCPP